MVPDLIERTIVIQAPVTRVWSVLTEPAFLGRWFGSGEPVGIDLRPGGLLVFDHGVHGVIPARIETVEPPRVLSWRWSQGAAGEEPDAAERHRANSLNWPAKLDELRAGCEQTRV